MGVFKPEYLANIEKHHLAKVVGMTNNYVEIETDFGIDLATLETYLEYGLAYAGPSENGFVFKKV